jgi:glycosyltransferase involved in cell wall biosynthesis
MNSTPHSEGVAIVVAVYNNVESILDVLSRLRPCGLPVIVVDDGSDDGTTEVLERWSDRESEPPCRVCRLEVNRGKAAAMQAGFDWARELDFTHALTFDADGQHDPDRIPAFLEALDASGPDVLVLGSREPLATDYPLRNRVGRATSNLAIRAQSGIALGDVPCGMRIYPLAAVESVRCISGRYAWEEEFITRAVWAGYRVESVVIPSIYAPYGERRSHYRFGRDWTEGIAVFLWLLLCSLVPSPRPSAWRRHLRGLFRFGGIAGGSMAERTERAWLVSWLVGIIPLSLLAPVLPLPGVMIALMVWCGIAWNGVGWLLGAAVVGYSLGAFVGGFIGLVVPVLALLCAITLVLRTGRRVPAIG